MACRKRKQKKHRKIEQVTSFPQLDTTYIILMIKQKTTVVYLYILCIYKICDMYTTQILYDVIYHLFTYLVISWAQCNQYVPTLAPNLTPMSVYHGIMVGTYIKVIKVVGSKDKLQVRTCFFLIPILQGVSCMLFSPIE